VPPALQQPAVLIALGLIGFRENDGEGDALRHALIIQQQVALSNEGKT
jgi:hypothetical protein